MISVAQMLPQVFKNSLLLFTFPFSSHVSCCQYSICGIWFNVLIGQGGPADTIVLETEIENNINDQEKRTAKMTLRVFKTFVAEIK